MVQFWFTWADRWFRDRGAGKFRRMMPYRFICRLQVVYGFPRACYARPGAHSVTEI